jgi:ribosomal protein S20
MKAKWLTVGAKIVNERQQNLDSSFSSGVLKKNKGYRKMIQGP